MQSHSTPSPATVPAGLTITGDVTAAEDLVIEGRIDGQIHAPDNDVSVGTTASLQAKIVARSVTLSGTLDGSIVASERVRVLEGASLRGHVTTPKLMLADGAQFNGTADPEKTEAAMHVARYRQKQGDGGAAT
jgi:cytoskeletal protein CcmA (bactofilin family)